MITLNSLAQITPMILGKTTDTPPAASADIAPSTVSVPTPSTDPVTAPNPGYAGNNYYVTPYPENQSSQVAFYPVPKPPQVDEIKEKPPIVEVPETTTSTGKSGLLSLATVPVLVSVAIWAVVLYYVNNKGYGRPIAHSRKKFQRSFS